MTAGKWWDLQELVWSLELRPRRGHWDLHLFFFLSSPAAMKQAPCSATRPHHRPQTWGQPTVDWGGSWVLKKLQEGREDWNVSQISIQGKRRKTWGYPAHHPLQNGELSSLVPIELLPPGLQVVKSCGSWLLLKSPEHKASITSRQLLRWQNRNIKDPCHCLSWWHPTLWIVPPWKFPEMWLGIPLRHSHSLASPSTNPAPPTRLLPLRGVDHRDAFRNLGMLSFISVDTSLEAWPCSQRNGHTVDWQWIVGIIWF